MPARPKKEVVDRLQALPIIEPRLDHGDL